MVERRISAPDPHRQHRVVSLSKAHLLPIVLVKPMKRWFRPDVTEKIVDWNVEPQHKEHILTNTKSVS